MQKIIAISIFSIFFIGCASRTTTHNIERAQYLLDIGTTFLVKGKYPDALRNLLEAKRIEPRSPDIRNNLGLTYFVMKKYDLALPEFQEALALKPNFTDARNNLGGLYIAVGNYPQALKELKIASEDLTYPQMQKVYNNIGLAFYRSNNFSKARDAFQKALIYQGENCQSLVFLGRSYYALEKYKEAVESLDRSVETCAGNMKEESFFYSGLSLLKFGQKEKAAGRFREVLGLFPKGMYAKQAQELLGVIK